MKTQWPHARLTDSASERRDEVSPGQQRTRTRYQPLERDEPLPAPGDCTITLSLKLLR